MVEPLKTDIESFMKWTWPQIDPYYQALKDETLSAQNVADWLTGWSQLRDLISERFARLRISSSQNTADKQVESAFNEFLDTIHPNSQAADQQLKEKLLASRLEPADMENPLRKMRAEAALFREANLPLLSEETKLSNEYNKIIGAQTVIWEGKEKTLQQLRQVYYQPDRAIRESAWRLASQRQLADRQTINALWGRQLDLRHKLAENAGMPDYRAYRWQQMLRLDYSPEDCIQFQEAIEAVCVPAATRVYEKQRQELGVESLRPWDLDLDLFPVERPSLPAYGSTEQLVQKSEKIFEQVDRLFGGYFATMRQENLLDLENRKGKAPGGYCTGLPFSKRPFIFMNAVGLFSDVRTMLHEAGHAFHYFEQLQLPYTQQRHPGLEFSEVASMSMELLTYPYLEEERGGFFDTPETRRAKRVHLERILTFWPYMAVVDAFQHWAYTHVEEAMDSKNCDEIWLQLWNRFIPGVDWSGLEDEAMTGWHRKQHIHRAPFYYVEYGVAQLGAVQVWSNAIHDQHAAVQQYRQALALGGTKTLPELYRTAGGKFAFDAETLREAIETVEEYLDKLDQE